MCNPHTVVPEDVLPSSTCCNAPKPALLQIDVNCRTIALTEPETHIEKSISRMAEKGLSPKECHMKLATLLPLSGTGLQDCWVGFSPPRSLQNDTLSILLKLNSQLRIRPGWICPSIPPQMWQRMKPCSEHKQAGAQWAAFPACCMPELLLQGPLRLRGRPGRSSTQIHSTTGLLACPQRLFAVQERILRPAVHMWWGPP